MLTLSSRLSTASAVALSVHFGQHLLAGRAHELQLPIERLLRAELGLGLRKALLGQRFARRLVRVGGLGLQELDLDQLVEDLLFHHRHLLGRDGLACGRRLRLERG